MPEVVSTDVLDCLPDEDVPWVLDELLRSVRREVTVTVTTTMRTSVLARKYTFLIAPRPSPGGWHSSKLRFPSPREHWQLIVHRRNAWGRKVTQSLEGGRRFNSRPTVWVLTDDHPGNTTQSLGLARALGWPYEVRHCVSPGLSIFTTSCSECLAQRAWVCNESNRLYSVGRCLT